MVKRERKNKSSGKNDLHPKRLKQLHALTRRIAPILDLDTLLTEIYRETLVLFATRDAAIVLNDDGEVQGADWLLRSRRSDGFRNLRLDTRRPGGGRYIAGMDRAVCIDDIFEVDGLTAASSARIVGDAPRSVLAAPIKVDGETVGLLAAGRNLGTGFSAEELHLMDVYSGHVSTAIRNAFMYRRERLSSIEWIKALDALNDGILVHDGANRILRVNQKFAEIVGLPLSDLTGISCSALPGGSAGSCPYCADSSQNRSAGSGVATFQVNDELGGLHSVVHVVKSGNGDKTAAWNGSLETLAGFISGIAHEVKSPITGIIGYSELALENVRDKKGSDDKITDYLNRIHSEGNRAYRVIHDLLYFARRQPSESGRVRVNDLLAALLESEARRIEKNGITLKTSMGQPPDVWGDPRQIQQVFANVLSNAIQALLLVDGERVLGIETAGDDGGVRVVIRDTGPGIPAAMLNRVFDPFYSTGNFGDGIGLGLSVAYGIVNSHGGEISVSSRGRGTEVDIRLPQRKGLAEHQADQAEKLDKDSGD
ncbi:MAG: GAF domain-containing protein [Nitrospirae bacterium]|nr:GAF domain-containing protein [Nitrospirota bacterium]